MVTAGKTGKADEGVVTLLVVLRLLTLLTRIVLAVVFVHLLVRTSWSGPRRRAWFIVGAGAILVTMTAGAGEVLHWGIIGDRGVVGTNALALGIYNLGYLANATAWAAVPLLLVTVLSSARGARLIAAAFAAGVMAYAAWGVTSGIVHEWEGLLETVRYIDFVAIGGNLLLWSLVVLRKVEIDSYLAAFLAVELLFLLLTPIQEVFFQAAGISGSQQIWDLHQLLQLAACAVQLAITFAVLRLVARGSVLPRLRLGGAL